MPDSTEINLILFDVDGCLILLGPEGLQNAISKELIAYHHDLWKHCMHWYGEGQLYLGYGTARQSFELLCEGNAKYGTQNVPLLLGHIKQHLQSFPPPDRLINLMEALLPDAIYDKNHGDTLKKMQEDVEHLNTGLGYKVLNQHNPSPSDHYKILIIFHAVMAFFKQIDDREHHKKIKIVLYDDRLEDVLEPLHRFLSNHPAFIANAELHLHHYFCGIKASLPPIQGCGAFDPTYQVSIRALLRDAGYSKDTPTLDIANLKDAPGSAVFFVEFKLLLLNIICTLKGIKNQRSEEVQARVSLIEKRIASHVSEIDEYILNLSDPNIEKTELYPQLETYHETHSMLCKIFLNISPPCSSFTMIETNILPHLNRQSQTYQFLPSGLLFPQHGLPHEPVSPLPRTSSIPSFDSLDPQPI